MDDESKQMLREIRDLQREQTELLRKYLLPPWMRMDKPKIAAPVTQLDAGVEGNGATPPNGAGPDR